MSEFRRVTAAVQRAQTRRGKRVGMQMGERVHRATVVALAAATGLFAAAALAQGVVVAVPPTIEVQPASRVRLAVEVGPLAAVAPHSFVRIRGLPATASLSEGHMIAPGSWAVPLAALPNLAVILPVGLQGRSSVAVTLVGVDGTVLAEAKTALVIAAAPARPVAKEPVLRAAPVLAAADRERALGLHAKGQEMLQRGNIYAARKFFEKAAEIGLAQSAVALADTHDPEELAKLRVVGIQADAAAAKHWYERARELGAAEASERLSRLGAR